MLTIYDSKQDFAAADCKVAVLPVGAIEQHGSHLPVGVPQSFMDYFDVSEVTEDGYWGFPEEGTDEKGEKVLALMVQSCLNYITEVERVSLKLKIQTRKQGDNQDGKANNRTFISNFSPINSGGCN